MARNARPSLLLLTYATGAIDAVSYLGLGGVFTANMTGNLVLLGFAMGGAAGFNFVRALTSLVGFAAGAWAAGRFARRWNVQPGRLMRRVSVLLTAALLVCWALIYMLAQQPENEELRVTIVALLACAMGMVNATARTLGVRDIPTTVATSTISDLAASAGRDMPRGTQLVRASAIGAMLLGAACGAALLRLDGMPAAFGLACAAAVAATVMQLRARREID